MRELILDTVIENPTFSHYILLPLSTSSWLPLLHLLTAFMELTRQCPSYFWALGTFSFFSNTVFSQILTSPMALWLHSSYCCFLLHIYLTPVMHSRGFLLFVLFHVLTILSHWIEFTHWSNGVSSNTSTICGSGHIPAPWCLLWGFIENEWMAVILANGGLPHAGKPWGSPFLELTECFAKVKPFFLKEKNLVGIKYHWWV